MRVMGVSPSLDNYVHRLVQNKGDGKLVEVMPGQGIPSAEKIDSLQLEVSPKMKSKLLDAVCPMLCCAAVFVLTE